MDNGIGAVDGIIYTYKHAEKKPRPGALFYKVTCYIDLIDIPLHINIYYVPGNRLDEFITGQAETGEKVTDIRPLKRKGIKFINRRVNNASKNISCREAARRAVCSTVANRNNASTCL